MARCPRTDAPELLKHGGSEGPSRGADEANVDERLASRRQESNPEYTEKVRAAGLKGALARRASRARRGRKTLRPGRPSSRRTRTGTRSWSPPTSRARRRRLKACRRDRRGAADRRSLGGGLRGLRAPRPQALPPLPAVRGRVLRPGVPRAVVLAPEVAGRRLPGGRVGPRRKLAALARDPGPGRDVLRAGRAAAPRLADQAPSVSRLSARRSPHVDGSAERLAAGLEAVRAGREPHPGAEVELPPGPQ